MRKSTQKSLGFTLAEMLLTIAIMMIISGIGFVAVITYSRNLRLNEMDSSAKEIYIAVQNQLSKAKATGTIKSLTSSSELGVPHTFEDGHVEYYIIYNPEDGAIGEDARHIALPFGAIDETIRSGRSYTIRYSLESAVVTQVYYSDEYSFTADDLTNEFIVGLESKDTRKKYNGNHIIGYYEGDSTILSVASVATPSLSVVNGNTLCASVSVSDANAKTLLCIEGLESGAQKVFNISEADAFTNKRFILDDITQEGTHFAKITSDNSNAFIPGENIEIFVTVQAGGGVLSNVAESKHIVENSLFAHLTGSAGNNIVQLSNIRHIENLDTSISGFIPVETKTEDSPASSLEVKSFEQIEDCSWSSFTEDGDIGLSVVTLDGSDSTTAHTYMPVNIDYGYTFQYNGRNRYIADVVVDTSTRDGGLFGNLENANISNLELHNFNIASSTASCNSGALAGTATNITVDKVLAYNPMKGIEGAASYMARESKLQIVSSQGNAGGLIGQATSGTVQNSSASLYVKASGSAGGLIGTTSSVSISNSYAGGHTNAGSYLLEDKDDSLEPGRPNIVGASAGGLVGITNGGAITSSYTTCSVQGNTFDSSYLLTGGSATVGTNCYGIGIACFEGTADNELTGFPNNTGETSFLSSTMSPAVAYDAYHKNDIYPYRTTSELNTSSDNVWFLKQHVGDWALPGHVVNIVNVSGDGSTSYGETYSSWASSEYASKSTPLTAESAVQRMNADVDILTAIARSYLGRSVQDVATTLHSAYPDRLYNGQGVVVAQYRNNGTATNANPQVKIDDISTFEANGYVATGVLSPSYWADSENRLFFSDFMNTPGNTAGYQVKVGNAQRDENNIITGITIYVYDYSGNQASVPPQLRITVSQ